MGRVSEPTLIDKINIVLMFIERCTDIDENETSIHKPLPHRQSSCFVLKLVVEEVKTLKITNMFLLYNVMPHKIIQLYDTNIWQTTK